VFIGTDLSLSSVATQGFAGGTRWEIDATGAAIRDAINDITRYGYSAHNLALQSEDFTAASWVKAAGATAPSAGTVVFDAQANSRVEHSIGYPGSTGLVAGQTGTASIELRADAPTQARVAATGAASYTTVSVTTDWQRFSVTRTAAGAENAYIIVSNVGGAAGTVYARRAQWSYGPAALTYVPTTSAAVGPSTPGWTLPGAGGARLNAAARSSAAMQVKVDGGYEYAAHNLLTYSEQFDNAAWNKSRSTVTADQVVAPNGTLTADKLIATAVGGTHRIYHSVSKAATALTYTMSVYAKIADPGVYSTVRLQLANGVEGASTRCDFDLNAVTVGAPVDNSFTGSNPTITAVGSGWYRLTFTAVTDTDTSVNSFVFTGDGTAGDGTAGVLIWGAQLNFGSTATAYIPTTTAAVYAPAVDWLAALSVYGLRSEPAATNLLRQSANLANVLWTGSTASAVTGISAPDGTTAAVTLTGTAANAPHAVYGTGFDLTNGTVYTLSVYAKQGAERYLSIRGESGAGNAYPWATFDLQAGTVGACNGVSTSTAAIRAEGTWFRCSLTWTQVGTMTSVGNAVFALSDVSTAPIGAEALGNAYAASGKTVLLWCPQLETGTVATSPILTYAASATRAADVPVAGVSDWYDTTTGTVAIDAVTAVASLSVGRVLLGQHGSTTRGVIVPAGTSSIRHWSSVPDYSELSSGQTIAANVLFRVAHSYDAAGRSIAAKGAAAASSAVAVGTVNAFALGAAGNGTEQFGGHIIRFRTTKRRLPNGVLQGLAA